MLMTDGSWLPQNVYTSGLVNPVASTVHIGFQLVPGHEGSHWAARIDHEKDLIGGGH
jgi:hypothetical protein